MKEMLRYGLILGLICVGASALLAATNELTKPRIMRQARAEEEASLKEIMPQGERFEAIKSEEGDVSYYKVYGTNDTLIGAAFKARGKGYSSVIDTMVGVSCDGTIQAIKVISLNETPGLGSRVAEHTFGAQFKNENSLELSGVKAITGATISSKAVMDSVKKKAQEVLRVMNNGK